MIFSYIQHWLGSERRERNAALARIGKERCRIARVEVPVCGATGAGSTGADGAPVAASDDDDDGGGGDADPDGRRPRPSTCLNYVLPPAQPFPAHPKPERLLRLPELKTRCGLSRTTIYQYIKDGKFPPPISIGARAVAWPESDIERWIAEQIQSSSSSR
ncbi:protein of unknown function [Cupriavidus taiwanensis]|uniref:Uncharacterized protein n=1 Tax=Cupriavidus taiwanensis TaxID=164546 RepID=A0A375IHI4_9BURK|nr:AlpA family transcriptional regulator [Cupriavidus taiwanensis]SPK72655.1 protein of unknown function [Cupriavidus taiwanensis]